MTKYYTYAYLRDDGTPYYIGKGSNSRVYKSHRHIQAPKDKSRILFLKKNLTEEEAFKHEKYMIAILGRKDLGIGILRNLTEGGEGISGFTHSEETKKKLRERLISEETRKKMSESKKNKTSSKNLLKKLRTAYQVCNECGLKYGRYVVGCSSRWQGVCDVCGNDKIGVTESRDYNYLSEGILKLTKGENK